MKVSIIIPFHHTKYLREAIASVEAQTYTDWEIILVPNGEALDALPDWLFDGDTRKRVLIGNATDTGNVGALKAFGFAAAAGDILVELDHDDMLTPDALEEIVRAFEENPDVGFAYSDVAHLTEAGQDFIPYNPAYGWRFGSFEWKGQGLFCMHSFKPDAAALASIHYAPDHVRAWRADVYRKIGGHDPTREICDDHELLIRTYLNTKMHHIEKCLYIYRRHDSNTSAFSRFADIQRETKVLCRQHGLQLAEREADLRGLLKVDIGGGIFKRNGYTSIDLHGGDMTHDLNEAPWPLADSSVGVLRASHVIEHLRDPLTTMCEAHRVLADGGWFMVDVPSTDGRGAFQDPTHVSFWNENSFLYYTNRDQAQYIHNSSIRFQSFRCETHFPNEWFKTHQAPVVTAWLRAIKGEERRPHLIQI